MQDLRFFEVQKWALFIKGKKTESYATQNGAFSSHIFFELQFGTATLIIPSFRMIKARGCKQRFRSDLFCRIFMQYYYTVV